jgi:hypothetical protein
VDVFERAPPRLADDADQVNDGINAGAGEGGFERGPIEDVAAPDLRAGRVGVQ